MTEGASADFPRTVGLLLGIVGFITMFVASVTLLAFIPVWFPDDDDEAGPALAGFAILSFVCGIAGWVVATGTGRVRAVALGVVIGYVVWLPVLIMWVAQGP